MRALRSTTSTASSGRRACAATKSSTAASSPRREYWGPLNEVYAEFFGAHKPGRLVATVPELHFGCLVEIEAVAELDED